MAIRFSIFLRELPNVLALDAVGDKEHYNDCQHDVLKYEKVWL
jgi:hypothetical protein